MNDLEHKSSPLELYALALEKGLDPDKLGKLLDLHERLEANRAAKEFSESLRLFQSKMPAVEKANAVFGKNRDAGPQYHFASYDDIMETAQPILEDCGIVITFDTEVINTQIATTCHVRVGTHVEDTTITLGLPTIPNANDSQRAGAALSYGKRYALVAALNIRVKGEDTDAVGLDAGLTDDQVKVLNDLLDECRDVGNEVNAGEFYKWLGCTNMNDMPASKFASAVWQLNRKRRAKK